MSPRRLRRRPRQTFLFVFIAERSHFQSPICWSCCFGYTMKEFMAFRASMINPNSRSPLRHESGEKETRKWRFSLRRLVFSLFSCLLRKLAIKKLFSCLKERRWREETSQPAIKVIGPLKLERKSPLDHSDLASFLPNEVVIQINIKTAVVAFFLLQNRSRQQSSKMSLGKA